MRAGRTEPRGHRLRGSVPIGIGYILPTFHKLMIPIPIGNDHTATATAEVWRDARCEHCACEFVYHVTVRARGQAMSPLFLAEEKARTKAAERARTDLERRLPGAGRLAPCPRCGKYQRAALRAERRRLLNDVMEKVLLWAMVVAAVVFLAGASLLIAIAALILISGIALVTILFPTRSIHAPPAVRDRERQNCTVLTRLEFDRQLGVHP